VPARREETMGNQSRDAADRRRDPRYEKSFSLEVASDSAEGLKAQSINISTRGLYCKVPRYLQPFSKLRVALDLPFVSRQSERIDCEGVVVRVDKEEGAGDYRLAIYFLDLDRRSAELIGEFLAEGR
jgi:hypothetical protein